MPESQRPNFLWLCTDQQRFDTIGALGNPYVSTPNIDQLVAEGVAFKRVYCQSPICTPSRASFLTGMYPSAVGVNKNGHPEFPSFPPLVTKILADNGYTCGLIGKLHLTSAYMGVEARTDDGYSYWQYSHAPRDDWERGHDYADWIRSKGKVLGELVKNIDGVPKEYHQTTWCAEKTIEFISQSHTGPWLASVNFYDPHPPFNPPKEYRDMFDPAAMPGPIFSESDLQQQAELQSVDFQSKGQHPDHLDIASPILAQSATPGLVENETSGARDAKSLQAAYYAMIKLIDDQIGRILNALETTGQRDNTVIIFMSDHGEALGDHGLIQKGCRFYEGLVRVPLIVSYPQKYAPQVVDGALVELVDIAPTLLDIVGLEIPRHMQGKSLTPILEGRQTEHRSFVRSEYYDALDLPRETFATMYFDGRYKLTTYHDHSVGELYDLQEDPHEFNNLWDRADCQEKKFKIIHRSFDASMLVANQTIERIGPM